ncbi:archaellar assembly protein FlaJ [Methanolobus halotolerans]|uniref:Type II secretion protein F n=1 Tax=Methanolobus halotolerans TaxID=2052935 RepID=A0A4E0PXL0_9EURY|nr:archaellar assembly protein FlaJ [Methanolobus halotolerans]TGC10874.1 type II secretion protein F [Methanolobus halotolerans]
MSYEKAFKNLDMEPKTYLKKFALPIIGFGVLFAILMYAVLPNLFVGPTRYIPALVTVVCMIFAFSYPLSILGAKAARIDNNMHYYITQMGSIATAETPRLDIIRIVSENEDYQELAEETRKIYDLVIVWNLSLADGCRFVSKRSPSIIFEDFLDRFAHALQSGEDVKSFLFAEQNVVMNEYESMYNGALYAVEVIKELFVSLVMSLIFMASFAVIMPVITGMNAELLMGVVVVVFLVTDLVMVMFTKSKIPKDPTWSNSRIVTSEKLKLYRSIPISIAGCIIVAIAVSLYGKIETSIAVAMVFTPLVYTGYVATKIEKSIRRKDENFPAFIRSLGSSAGARGGVIDDALKALRAHDFGPLTKDVNNLYKMLVTRIDKITSWEVFSANTGSNLIQRFSVMFVEATNLGGKPEVIGDIIATNFHRIVALRKKRSQSAGSLVGVLYGLTGGIGFTMYISLGVVGLMQDMFAAVEMPAGMSMGMVLYTNVGSMDTLANMVLAIMIGHSLMSAILIRVVDGGHMLSATIDFVIMVWISGASAVVTMAAVSSLLGIT